MVDINSTVFIQIINFLVLIFVMNQLLYKPILKILDKRREKIAAAENEVKNLNQTIENKMSEYEGKIQQAKLEAMGERNEILQEGAVAGKEILDGAKKDISTMMDEFQQKLNGEVEDAKRLLHDQSGKISIEIAEKVLGRNVQ